MRKGGVGHNSTSPEKLTPSELVISVSKVKAQNVLKKSVNMHNFLQWILRHSDSTKTQPSSQQSNYEERKKKKREKYVFNRYLIGASIQKMQGISQLNNQKTNDPTEKQAKTWTDTPPKKIYKWPMGTWEKSHCTTGCIEKELSEPRLTAPQAATIALMSWKDVKK